jgi:hypothetical protein
MPHVRGTIIYDDFGLSSILSRERHDGETGQVIVGRGGRVVRRGTRLQRGKEGGGDVRRLTGLRRLRLFVWSATPLRPAHLASSSSPDACVLRTALLPPLSSRQQPPTVPFCPRRQSESAQRDNLAWTCSIASLEPHRRLVTAERNVAVFCI